MATSRIALWAAFVAVNVWLAWLSLAGGSRMMGDIDRVYAIWMDQGVKEGFWVGIDVPWVYPMLALVPMLISHLGGFGGDGVVWMVLVAVLNAGAFVVLTSGSWAARRGVAAAWWWIAFLFVLGPIAMARIDAITVPLALVGMLVLAKRPHLAGVLLAVAAWVKVWPAALVLAAVVAVRRRGSVLVGAVATSVVVVAVALALGSGWNVFGFVSQQAGRGLQVESPAATPWLWQVAAHVPGAAVYYDQIILTYQVAGPGVAFAARATTVVMAIVMLGVLLLGVWAVRAGVPAPRLLGALSLALVIGLIATNKVGSPQFVSWLAVPVVVGIVLASRGGPSFRVPAVIALAIGLLTQLVYPLYYEGVLGGQPLMVAVITVRNGLEVALLVVSVVMLWRVGTAQPGAPRSWWTRDVRSADHDDAADARLGA
ncbi:glycosyltransferase 87 family protein [Frigoribacterium sp. 2-23]|uniref:glycosyltransferase 87 family protein n=1 Tax=Frigoribacterium sp. 2-23 TaxID=3415006 RepID=UPI003C6ED093